MCYGLRPLHNVLQTRCREALAETWRIHACGMGDIDAGIIIDRIGDANWRGRRNGTNSIKSGLVYQSRSGLPSRHSPITSLSAILNDRSYSSSAGSAM